MLTLPVEYILFERYQIINEIGFGGFGITYKAIDLDRGRAVCVKELFVFGKCSRNSDNTITSIENEGFSFKKMVKNFLGEGQRLTQFSSPHIVSIIDVFYENNTAYLVLDYIEGVTLKQYIDTKGLMSVDLAFNVVNQILDAVELIHSKKMLHRDIKPENIIITPENIAVLLDFGAAREYSDDKTIDQTAMVTPGYAPIEQYNKGARKGQYTDIYALGATLYFLLTGKKPLNATERIYNELKAPHEINLNISSQVSSAIMLAMQMKPADRFQSVGDLRKAMQLLQSSAELVEYEKKDESDKKKPPPYNPVKKGVGDTRKMVGGLLLLGVLFIGSVVWNQYSWKKLKNRIVQEIEDRLVEVPGGDFMQGCFVGRGKFECDDDNDEIPAHRVTISPFEIGKFEVTQEQWYAIMHKRPSIHKNCDSCPVENVSWDDIKQFIDKLNNLSSGGYRLPREAEWEFVARNREMPKVPTGYAYKYVKDKYVKGKKVTVPIGKVAWFKDNSEHKTHPVGQKPANKLRVHDLIGNVREWCSDWYVKDYYTNNESVDPKGPQNSPINCRVLRGGCFSSGSKDCRIVNRAYHAPHKKNEFNGLRLAKD